MYVPNPFPPIVGYNSDKAAQIAALFLLRAGRGLSKLKLIKLLYISEREFLRVHGLPLTMDEFFSIQHGPVCSASLNGLNGNLNDGLWGRYFRRQGNNIFLQEGADEGFDELSEAEIEIIDDVWRRFGSMTASQLRAYTHRHFAEYQRVDAGRIPISYLDILNALGDPDAVEINEDINELRYDASIYN